MSATRDRIGNLLGRPGHRAVPQNVQPTRSFGYPRTPGRCDTLGKARLRHAFGRGDTARRLGQRSAPERYERGRRTVREEDRLGGRPLALTPRSSRNMTGEPATDDLPTARTPLRLLRKRAHTLSVRSSVAPLKGAARPGTGQVPAPTEQIADSRALLVTGRRRQTDLVRRWLGWLRRRPPASGGPGPLSELPPDRPMRRWIGATRRRRR